MKFKHKNTEGFSLVELIVVIVILAILIGVTIAGVFKYVNDARKNTDTHNAKQIEKLLHSAFVTGEYWNSPSFKSYMETNWTTMEGTDTHTDINNGNAVYIMKWNDYVFNQFQTDPDYADFPTLYYRTVNSIENRAWFIWRWLAYNIPYGEWNSQNIMDSIPVAKQSGYCFYLVFSFTDDGSAGNLEVYCAPDNLAMGSTVYSRDLWDALQPYKMD